MMRFLGPTLFLKRSKTLVFSDVHCGAEEVLVGQGVLLPRTQMQEIFSLLKEILTEAKPLRIIINGDLKHDFGSIGSEEWRDVLELIDMLQKYAPVEVVKGNHDAMLLPILKKRNVPFHDYVLLDDVLIVHGHVLPPADVLAKASLLVIGHEHPSIFLDDGLRKEKYKCFLKGTFHGKKLIVLPSIFPLVEGSDVLKEMALGPIFKEAKNLEVYVVEGMQTLFFGDLASYMKNFK
jgi:putative SbcD/Mre11-related phosphoesterase